MPAYRSARSPRLATTSTLRIDDPARAVRADRRRCWQGGPTRRRGDRAPAGTGRPVSSSPQRWFDKLVAEALLGHGARSPSCSTRPYNSRAALGTRSRTSTRCCGSTGSMTWGQRLGSATGACTRRSTEERGDTVGTSRDRRVPRDGGVSRRSLGPGGGAPGGRVRRASQSSTCGGRRRRRSRIARSSMPTAAGSSAARATVVGILSEDDRLDVMWRMVCHSAQGGRGVLRRRP